MSFKGLFIRARGVLGSLTLAIGVLAASAACATAAPVLELRARANTSAAPGETGLRYTIDVRNVGDEPTAGALTFHATLPAWLVATGAASEGSVIPWECEAGQFPTATVTCTNPGIFTPLGTAGGAGFSPIQLTTEVQAGASGVLTPKFEIWGDGTERQPDGEACGTAPPETPCGATLRPTAISTVPPVFGIAAFDSSVSDMLGNPFTQAAGHPYAISTWIDFNTYTNPKANTGSTWPVEPTKDVVVELPPGFVGAPAALAKCTSVELAHTNGGVQEQPLCPAASQVGTADVSNDNGIELFHAAIYNMVPSPGVPAAFGFNVGGTTVMMDAELRSGSDYGLTVQVKDIPEVAMSGAKLTFWGTPGDPSHDRERMCPGTDDLVDGGKTCPAGVAHPVAFLRNPSSCTAAGEALVTRVSADSWVHPGVFVHESVTSHALPGYPSLPGESGAPVGITGCEGIPFDPQISVAPSTHAASSPTGLDVDVSLPQNSDPTAPGTADLKDAVVMLPEGLRVNPSSADGLGACSSAQIGLVGTGFPAPNPIHFTTSEVSCPDSSRIGTVTIETPLLSEALTGSVYLAAQGDNPFASLLAIYLVAKAQGVLVKLPGHVEADPLTGRLTTRFDDQPQLPFSHLHVVLFNGPRAALMTPDVCGAAGTSAEFDSWAQPGVPVSRGDSFQVTSGPGGGACLASRPFAPSFSAGTVNPQAGGFSPFTLTLSRGDADRDLGGLSVTMAPGLLGVLKSVTQCGEPQAAQGACGAASLIGHVTVGAGAGPSPLFLGGQVFLTGPYAGAPFGLSIVVPAKAGPFDLGMVVVRARVQVDPHTAQITVVSDAFPQILQGIPVDMRTVNVTVDRAGFIFNPTDCAPLAVAGTASSADGASAPVASRFQAANCASLPFHPGFQVSTQARTSRAAGASLHVHVGSGAGQANIGRVVVSLPKQLPSWLPTLQKACVDSVFAANPASCPAGSVVGTATASTPVLAHALSGPAYLVSHGGAAFPDLVVVLQGEGITLDLDGGTSIKGKVTTSSFDTVPDAPISSFDLTLPEGPHHVLAAVLPAKAKGSLCGQVLTMPTAITGQNGAVLKQSTKIAVTGCAKPKKKHKQPKHKAKPNHKKG